uniref:DUF834 domain-containing protein n=1 Tax=Leersia perrieri TaxID=77586 RepID=A0A0D9WXM6_9ORYZ
MGLKHRRICSLRIAAKPVEGEPCGPADLVPVAGMMAAAATRDPDPESSPPGSDRSCRGGGRGRSRRHGGLIVPVEGTGAAAATLEGTEMRQRPDPESSPPASDGKCGDEQHLRS